MTGEGNARPVSVEGGIQRPRAPRRSDPGREPRSAGRVREVSRPDGADERAARGVADRLGSGAPGAGPVFASGPTDRMWVPPVVDRVLGSGGAPLARYWWARGLLREMLDAAERTAALPSAAALPPDASSLLLWARGDWTLDTG